MPRSFLREIERLDPVSEHWRIVFLTTFHEFPWDSTRALEYALFRTFAVPSIARQLEATGEFTKRAQKRYDDTDLLLSEVLEYGYDSERGRAALRRINRIHSRFDITNADYLYVLSTFVFEPIRWIDRFGWRPLSSNERLAQFYYWREVGRRMNIADIPPTTAEFESFNKAYEAENFAPSAAGTAVCEAVRELLLGWILPRPLHSLGAPFAHAIMDPPLLAAAGFDPPAAWVTAVVSGSLRARSRLVRFMPERTRPKRRTLMRRPTYPNGYRLEALGPDDATAYASDPSARD
jgi:hypothetical protein